MHPSLEPATDLKTIGAILWIDAFKTQYEAPGSINSGEVIGHHLEYLKDQGIRRIILATCDTVRNSESLTGGTVPAGVSVEWVRTCDLATACRLPGTKSSTIRSDTFFLLRSSSSFHCDLPVLLAHHQATKAQVTFALKLLSDTGKRTVAVLDNNYRITDIQDSSSNIREGYVCTGVCVVRATALDTIAPDTTPWAFEHDAIISGGASGIALPGPLIDLIEFAGVADTTAVRRSRSLPAIPPLKKQPAIFLDRDGVVNEDSGYPYKPEHITFKNEIFDFCRNAQAAGYLLVVVSNQAGVAKGKFTFDEVTNLHVWMKGEFSKRKITIADFVFCPYHERGTVERYIRKSLYRKPEPGMILDAAENWNIDLPRSVMVGDKVSDRIRLPYLKSYIIKSSYTETGYDFESLQALAAVIFNGNKPR